MKPADVPVYVEHGIADCGVVGRDVFMESGTDLLQPVTLSIGHCRIVVAALAGVSLAIFGMLRVATKYPRIAAAHFGARGRPVELSSFRFVELAPTLGLADCIVDLVSDGRNPPENGLKEIEEIGESTGRLVVNRASYQLKAKPMASLIAALRQAQAGE